MARLIFLSTDSRPWVGGIASYLDGLCAELARAGHTVELRSSVPGAAAAVSAYAVRQLRARPQRRLGERTGDAFAPWRKLNTLLYYRRLAELAREDLKHWPKDGIAVVFWWDVASHAWCRQLRRSGIRYALVCHGAEFCAGMDARTRRWMAEDFENACAVLPNSRATGELLRRATGRNIDFHVSAPVSDHALASADPARVADLRRRLGIADDACVILSLGRMIRRKGIDHVIAALGRLRERAPRTFFVAAGDGPEKASFKELASRTLPQGSYAFIAIESEAMKSELFALCDIFAMPNRSLGGTDWEGFGIVFIEAALAAKPSVAGRDGGAADAVEHGVTGLIVDGDRVEDIAGAFFKLIEDRALRQRMGQAARERAERQFTGSVLAARFAGIVLGQA